VSAVSLPLERPLARRLDGNRLHLAHGPIDLVIQAFGPDPAVERAYRAATGRFAGLLDCLVAVLPRLRQPVGDPTGLPAPALLMHAATAPLADRFVTPMAAVAGAVADTIMAAIRATPGIERAYVNNRGDIAVHLTPSQTLDIGVVPELHRPLMAASIRLRHEHGIGGVATSGWAGRSFSLGIADAVTVLAETAARADAAATLIANAVDIEHPAIRRAPARSLDPDSDLGWRLVTVDVGPLAQEAVAVALDNGTVYAEGLLERGLIRGAMLALQGEARVIGRAWEEIGCSS
jgi:ApbE superfamily uncharacterized protein (UPF0280 family)